MANNNHFTLTLDTLAPTGSISRGDNHFVKENFALTITKGDATFMYVWFDTSATTSTIPSGTSPIAAASSYTTTFSADGTYYYHCVLMDDVGNKSEVYHTDVIIFDITKPTVNAVELLKRDGTSTEVVTTRDIAIRFKATDNLSGLVSCAISGDINPTSTAWVSTLTAAEIADLLANKYVTRNIVLSGTGEEESTKTVSITVTDASGNTADAVSDTIQLDTKFLVGNIILRDAADSKTITNTWVNTADFNIALDASQKSDWKGYKVWGDFNTDGSATGTTEPASYTDLTDAEKTAKRVLLPRKFTSGDATAKTVYAKIVDDNGNETTLTSQIAKVDYTAPTVSFVIQAETGKNANHVSKVDGFKTKVLVPTTDASISGAATYQWYMNGSAFSGTGASGTGDPVNLTVSSDNMGDEGVKAFTLKVTDNAGNSTTSSAVNIYLDTTAPSGTITMAAWYNGDAADQTVYKKFSTAGATASATDGPSTEGVAAGMKYMTCWCSQTATDTTVPTSATQIAYAVNPTHSQIDWTGHGESSTNYIHIEYVDEVGNKAIMHSAAFGIDTVVPDAGTVTFTKEAYPSTSAQVILGKSDATSGMGSGAQFKVWGDITVSGTAVATEAAASWESIADSKSVVLTTGDGTKNIYVRYKDVAGNISTGTASSDSTELDTSTPSITPTIHVSGSTDAKPAISNLKESDMHIKISDDATGKVFYQVYGDFTTNGTQSAQGLVYKACTLYAENTAYAADALVLHEGAVYKAKSAITAAENTSWSAISSKMEVNTEYWKEYVVDSGKDYKNIATVCTSGDGTKNFRAKAMDNAGNITEESAVSFVYDTTAPVVTVNEPDFNRLSKVQTKRLKNESGTITELEKYNDLSIFTFTADSIFVEYKVCAYVSQAAAEAGSHETPAIPTTSTRSVNMTGTGTFGPGQTTTSITSTICGTDYESALLAAFNTSGMSQAEAEAAGFVFEDGEINAIDGAHIVVVYVKDQGGTWSVAADFSV